VFVAMVGIEHGVDSVASCLGWRGQVAIVGSIINLESKSTNTMYTIDDGTAQIEVMFWASGEESEQQIRKNELWACVLLS
jgi:hypothetical protein